MTQEEVWKTSDGREIPVGEMDEEHVKNVLRMILRRRRKMKDRIERTRGGLRAFAELVRPYLKEMDQREAMKQIEEDEKLFDSLNAEILEDRMWGSDG